MLSVGWQQAEFLTLFKNSPTAFGRDGHRYQHAIPWTGQGALVNGEPMEELTSNPHPDESTTYFLSEMLKKILKFSLTPKSYIFTNICGVGQAKIRHPI
jgi:hypothetical protein